MESEYEAIVCFKLLTHFVETHILNPDVFIISKLKQFSEMDMNLFFWGRVFIDYKVGCFVKEKFVTISCIEVGKFVESNKVRDDHHKLLLEGKTIINNIIKEFKFIDPKSIPVLGVQICGIKGDLVEIILASKKLYVAHRPLKRLRVPLNCNDSDSANTFLRQLLYYKKHLADFSYDLKQMVNNHDDEGII
ncbi:hypothetical protein EDC94DRAFT_557285 [Helicostylum pulchrum]|nr:hypothetical protein EDC94DRAFT_557285 [Helicostylum pulchrum]